MVTLKILIYCVTIAAMFFFASWEMRLKRRLTEDALQTPRDVVDFGVLDALSDRMERERFLKSLPPEKLFKFRVVMGLKFLFIAMLIIEVICLQKPQ
jgi:hypothetical protein